MYLEWVEGLKSVKHEHSIQENHYHTIKWQFQMLETQHLCSWRSKSPEFEAVSEILQNCRNTSRAESQKHQEANSKPVEEELGRIEVSARCRCCVEAQLGTWTWSSNYLWWSECKFMMSISSLFLRCALSKFKCGSFSQAIPRDTRQLIPRFQACKRYHPI